MKFLLRAGGALLIAIAVLEFMKGLAVYQGGDRLGIYLGTLVLALAGAGLIVWGIRRKKK